MKTPWIIRDEQLRYASVVDAEGNLLFGVFNPAGGNEHSGDFQGGLMSMEVAKIVVVAVNRKGIK